MDENDKHMTVNRPSSDAPSSENIDIYRPVIRTEKPLKLDEDLIGYSDTLTAAMDNGMIQTRLEENVVKQRISRELYEKPSSGLRELFANEVRACRTAKNKHGADPAIEITINPDPLKRKLSIQGFDSMGISTKLFTNVVVYLGRSDNFSGKETGQFGFGLASYTCLSDIMILETYSRQTGEKFAVMGKNGMGFNILPKPTIDSYGTKITVTLRDGIDIEDLVKHLESFVRFCGIDVHLILENHMSVLRYSVGSNPLPRLTFSEQLDRVISDNRGDDDEVAHIQIEIHEDDYEFYGRFAFTKSGYGDESYMIYDGRIKDGREVLLLGLPINAGINLPLSCYVLNILDERKYKPTPDRERLTEDASDSLQEKIMHKLFESMTDGEIKSPSEFSTHKYGMLYENRNSIFGRDVPPLSPTAISILDFLDTKIVTDEAVGTFLKKIIQPNMTLVRLKALRSDRIMALHRAIPNAAIFRTVPSKNSEFDELCERVQCEIIDGDDYFKTRGLAPIRNSHARKEVTVRYVYWFSPARPDGKVCKKVFSDELENNMIRVTKEQDHMLHELMHGVKTEYMTVRNKKNLIGGIAYDDFIRYAADINIQTSDGFMTLREISRCKKNIYLAQFDKPDMLNRIGSIDKTLIILNNSEILFKAMAFLNELKVPFEHEKGHYNMDRFWNIVGMNKFFSASDLEYGCFKGDTRFETMLKMVIYTKSINDSDLQLMFVCMAGNNDSEKSIDELYDSAHRLDQRIATLQKLASKYAPHTS